MECFHGPMYNVSSALESASGQVLNLWFCAQFVSHCIMYKSRKFFLHGRLCLDKVFSYDILAMSYILLLSNTCRLLVLLLVCSYQDK